MRDPDRIDPILAKIRDLWLKNPDLRLGQLIVGLVNPFESCPSVFNIEDDTLSAHLEARATEAAAVPPRDPYRRPLPGE